MAYPAPKMRKWQVQIEFFDGTVIDAVSDEDVIERWRRIAAWSDPTVEAEPVDWMNRVLDRARTFYGAPLVEVDGDSDAALILDRLSEENCLYLRRK